MHSYFLTLVSDPNRGLSENDLDKARAALSKNHDVDIGEANWLQSDVAAEIVFSSSADPTAFLDSRAIASNGIDASIQPVEERRKKVLVADMDSTMIQIETLDMLAAELGLGEKVIEITNRSMNGALDFVDSLKERVALLKGYRSKEAMETVMSKVTHSPGARIAVRTMAENGARCALVSGGFTFTTQVVHADLGFHEHHANELLIGDDGVFTGEIGPVIVGRPSKQERLEALCDLQGVSAQGACAVGDGANDLDMLMRAGLGVAYYGKPIVREKARTRIDYTDLTSLLFFQGYHRDEFVID